MPGWVRCWTGVGKGGGGEGVTLLVGFEGEGTRAVGCAGRLDQDNVQTRRDGVVGVVGHGVADLVFVVDGAGDQGEIERLGTVCCCERRGESDGHEGG